MHFDPWSFAVGVLTGAVVFGYILGLLAAARRADLERENRMLRGRRPMSEPFGGGHVRVVPGEWENDWPKPRISDV